MFSNASFHRIPDHHPVRAHIARGFRPGGRLLVQMGGKGNAAQMFEARSVLLGKRHWARYFDGFSFTYGFFCPREDRPGLTDAGFGPIRVDLIPNHMTYPDLEAFAGQIRTTWLSRMARLPEGEQPEFIRALIDGYLLRHPPDADGIILIGMVRLEAEAIKLPE